MLRFCDDVKFISSASCSSDKSTAISLSRSSCRCSTVRSVSRTLSTRPTGIQALGYSRPSFSPSCASSCLSGPSPPFLSSSAGMALMVLTNTLVAPFPTSPTSRIGGWHFTFSSPAYIAGRMPGAGRRGCGVGPAHCRPPMLSSTPP